MEQSKFESRRRARKVAQADVTWTDLDMALPGHAAEIHGVLLRYMKDKSMCRPLLVRGDALDTLRNLPSDCIDCVMTSPPYWSKREYVGGAKLGLEADWRDYVGTLSGICGQIMRILKPKGSFWLNIGDSYRNKKLLGIPWRVALELTDSQGWMLRNDVIWNKVKGGMDNTKDRLGCMHEHVFHFVKQSKYYYDTDAIRSKPGRSKVVNGSIVSASGVSGVRYKRQIETSTDLTHDEKASAFRALDAMLSDVQRGEISDFRMIIRKRQRATHSDSQIFSGRAKELQERGFYFLKYHPNGSKPRDVWDIMPEDTQNRNGHFAPYPVDLCRIPILATCPPGGIVLDPFCGTGTTLLAAMTLGRKSLGVDVSREYLEGARKRCTDKNLL